MANGESRMPTILLIDDEAPLRKMLRTLLERNGFQVLEAPDGRHGVALYKAHHPDLVITDLIMPEKEGLEVIRELKVLDPDVKIIAVSGGGIVDPVMYLKLAENFGAQYALSKPISNKDLLSIINTLLAN